RGGRRTASRHRRRKRCSALKSGNDADLYSRPEQTSLRGLHRKIEPVLQLNNVLVKACANDPKKRYESAAQMHRDLATLERGERPGKSRTKVLLAAMSIVAVAVAGVWFWLNHPQPSVGLHLQTTVRTEPPGALVVLGDHAQKSPATFADLEPRKYNLRIMSPGYEPVESAVDLSAKRSFDPAAFRLLRSKGALEIQSEPPG